MSSSDFRDLIRYCQQGRRITLPNGRCAGYVTEQCFYKPLKRSQHFFHSPPAIAIDEKVFREELAFRCKTIVVLEMEREEILEVQSSTFSQKCFRFNRGHGTQLGLALKWWNHRNSVRQLSFSEVGAW